MLHAILQTKCNSHFFNDGKDHRGGGGRKSTEKKPNKGKGKTAATSSTNVQSIMEPQKEEAEKTSQKQKER